MDISYRLGIKEDEKRINELFIQMLEAINENREEKFELNGYPEGYIDKFVSGGPDIIYIAEADGRTVGFISVECHWEGGLAYVYIDDFSVDAEYRRQGIGTRLMDMAERYAADGKFECVVLHVEVSNQDAYRMYSARGYFDIVGEGSRIKMAKELGASSQDEKSL